uniref:RNA uridylyltransferase n=1 Tax=Mesocestoides corti TaxID=53468 RepID=A0A5K3EH01_MESCO
MDDVKANNAGSEHAGHTGNYKDQAIAHFIQQIPSETLHFLNINKIYGKFRGGKPTLSCHACNLQFKSTPQALQHAQQTSHRDVLRASLLSDLLKHLPPITEAHRIALNEVLEERSSKLLLDQNELNRRREFAHSVCVALEFRIKGLRMSVIGSTVSGLASVDSDVNLDAFMDSVDRTSDMGPKSEVPSFVDPYKKGFNSVLPEIYDLLKANVIPDDTPEDQSKQGGDSSVVMPQNHDPDLPPFPAIHRVTRCYRSEQFYVSFCDSESVFYRVTVGNPEGHHFATLISTYLSVDDRAQRLMILVVKFAKMAHLTDPQRHTFQSPVLPLLVIFFLQHTTPPILPNLHEIVRRHRDVLPPNSIETVLTEEGDFSFLKDLSLLPQFFPSTIGNASEVDKNTMTLADLWLQFLRFYTFDFQSRTCIVSITNSHPVSKFSRGGSCSALWVENPFYPSMSMTRNLMPSTSQYIRHQFLACYSYFGVPRLAKNGRPLFIKVEVQIIDKDEPQEEDGHKQVKPINCTKQEAGNTATHKVLLLNSLDPSNKFESQLNKVTALFAEIFATKAIMQSPLQHNSDDQYTVKEPPKYAELSELLPHTMKLAFSEICQPGYVEYVAHACLAKARNQLRNDLCLYSQLDLAQMTILIRNFCLCLWQSICSKFQEKGLSTTTAKRLARFGVQALRSTLQTLKYILRSKDQPRAPPLTSSSKDQSEAHEQEHTLTPPHTPREKKLECVGDVEHKSEDAIQECPYDDNEYGGLVSYKASHVDDDFSMDDKTPDTVLSDLNDSTNVEEDESVPNNDTGCVESRVEEPSTTLNLSCSPGLRKEAVNAVDASESWSKYIKNSDNYFKIIDSDSPGYYNSKVSESLRPEDYSFPFVSNGFRSPGKFKVAASVLGLAFWNEPSTMLAYHSLPAPVCLLCGNSGHESHRCDSKPNQSISLDVWRKLAKDVPSVISAEHLQELSDCLQQLSSYHASNEINQVREKFVGDLNDLFRLEYPTVSLKLFGSCANGFETTTSDMDICVFFPANSSEALSLSDPKERLNMIKSFKRILNQGARGLKITNILPILSAKVPIIKFRVEGLGEADLSFSNYLAITNTSMLRFYNQIDPRLRVLNIALKVILRTCNVAKSSSGGISSYAFAIMMIHYLQQIDFLPVLQELYEGVSRPIIRAGDWNVWYQDNIEIVRKLWHPPSKDVSVAELWLGFLRYYLFDFDRERYVVTINQKPKLERFAKLWNSLLAVEGKSWYQAP